MTRRVKQGRMSVVTDRLSYERFCLHSNVAFTDRNQWPGMELLKLLLYIYNRKYEFFVCFLKSREILPQFRMQFSRINNYWLEGTASDMMWRNRHRTYNIPLMLKVQWKAKSKVFLVLMCQVNDSFIQQQHWFLVYCERPSPSFSLRVSSCHSNSNCNP